MTEILLLAVIFGILSCDTVLAGQFMYSRPLIAGPIAGFVLGNPYAGFIAGLCVELIWIRVIPIGDSTPPDSTLTAVLAASAAAAASRLGLSSYSAVIPALAISVPFGIVYKMAELQLRSDNSAVVDSVKVKIIRGDFPAVDRAVFYAIVKKFFFSVVFFIVSYMLVTALPEGYWRIMDMVRGVEVTMKFIYILCFAQLFEMFLKWK